VSEDRWIVVPKWHEFQHYKDRVPPWIKVYLELLDKDEFATLNASDRGVLMTIWLLYARQKGPFRVSKVRSNARTKSVERALERLNHAGFIEVRASNPLAPEKRREERDGYGEVETPVERELSIELAHAAIERWNQEQL
jgi:hypothetical protein